MSTIGIIGAGITGVTTAYALMKQGRSVILFDRHRYPAMETSFANGGQLSACNAEVWNSWGNIARGLKWMLRADAPLLVNPSLGLHKYGWFAEFTSNIRHHRKNSIATTRLAITARQRLVEIAEAEQIDFDLEQRGILHIYRDAGSYRRAAKGNALLAEGGLERRAVTPQEIGVIEPALTGSFVGGFFTPSDSTGDIHKFTQGLLRACLAGGVAVRLDTEVLALKSTTRGVSLLSKGPGATPPQATDLDAVVICAGVASRRFAAMAGDRLNIYPVKGYSITIALNDPQSVLAAPWTSLLDEDAKIVTSRLGPGRFRVAGTAEFNGENRDIRMDRIRPLIRWSEELFPEMNTSQVTPWAGLRPMTPDMMPRVGRGRREGIFYNTGHGHLGWTLSAATADIVAAQIDLSLADRRFANATVATG